MKSLHLFLAVVALFFSSCTTTTAYRHKNGSLTVSQHSRLFGAASSTSYWITGANPGRISPAEDLTVFRKRIDGKPGPAVPLKCSGFIDATTAKRIEIRLAEKQAGSLSQSRVNGLHKLIDESAPKPFYHWLIP
jgi:hypothetical protein